MSLKASIKSDSTAIFLLSDDFAETVVYRPRNGGSRSILALVDRDPPSFWDASGVVVSPTIVLHVANCCTTGIRATELDTGGDGVEVSVKQNELPRRTMAVMQLMYQDDGILRIALR